MYVPPRKVSSLLGRTSLTLVSDNRQVFMKEEHPCNNVGGQFCSSGRKIGCCAVPWIKISHSFLFCVLNLSKEQS